MKNLCPECGASVPDGGACRDNFNALLLLEWQILGAGGPAEPDGPSALAHFFAVSAYGLQHPDSMNYTAQALAGLREAVADAVHGKATLGQLRSRARHVAEGAERVTRRPGDSDVPWRRAHWPTTVADVLTVEATVGAYAKCVAFWARSTIETLNQFTDGERISP